MANRDKILFLDVDGVLNNHQWCLEQADIRKEKGGIYHRDTFDQSQFEPRAVALLDHVVDAVPGLEIVISSTWRNIRALSDIRGLISRAGGIKSSKVIIGKTGNDKHGHRGTEIKEWVDNFEPENYVILDDDDDMTEHQIRNHFVQTDFMEGLTEHKANVAIAILLRKIGV